MGQKRKTKLNILYCVFNSFGCWLAVFSFSFLSLTTRKSFQLENLIFCCYCCTIILWNWEYATILHTTNDKPGIQCAIWFFVCATHINSNFKWNFKFIIVIFLIFFLLADIAFWKWSSQKHIHKKSFQTVKWIIIYIIVITISSVQQVNKSPSVSKLQNVILLSLITFCTNN